MICSVHCICLPHSLHHVLIIYVYHTHFTTCSSCMLTIVTLYVYFTMDIHSLLYVHHYHFTDYLCFEVLWEKSQQKSVLSVWECIAYYMFTTSTSNITYVLKCCGKSPSKSQFFQSENVLWANHNMSTLTWGQFLWWMKLTSLHKCNILFPFVFAGCWWQNS